MSDQCQHCIVRGDFEKCQSTDCNYHDNWYAQQLQKLPDSKPYKWESFELWFLDSDTDERADIGDAFNAARERE